VVGNTLCFTLMATYRTNTLTTSDQFQGMKPFKILCAAFNIGMISVRRWDGLNVGATLLRGSNVRLSWLEHFSHLASVVPRMRRTKGEPFPIRPSCLLDRMWCCWRNRLIPLLRDSAAVHVQQVAAVFMHAVIDGAQLVDTIGRSPSIPPIHNGSG
jgi:hypothetical protein